MASSSVEELRAAIEAAPEDPHCYNAMAVHLLTVENKPDEAEEMYKKALSKDPAHLESLANYGVLMAQIRGENGEARKLFQRALKAAPGNPEVLSSLASLAHLEGDLASAEKLYKQVLSKESSHVSALLNYALLLSAQGRLDEASAQYEVALEHDKSGGAHHQFAVFSQQQRNDTSTARAMFKRSYEINKENTSLLVDYGTFSERIDHDYKLAEKLYSDCLALDENNTVALTNMGLFYMNVNKNKSLAKAFLHRALECEPSNVTFLKNFGAFHFDMRNDPETALKLFEKALREGNKVAAAARAQQATADPDSEDGSIAVQSQVDDELAPPGDDPEILGQAALAAIELRRYDDAESFYKRGLKASANDPYLLCNYALFLKDTRKEYEAATLQFRRAIAADTDHVTTAISGYAMLLYHHMNDKAEAEKLLAQAAEYKPNDADSLANYGSVMLERSGTLAPPENAQVRFKAYNILQRAYELDETHPGANAALGHYYYAIDPQPERALVHLDAALERNPKSADALMSLALLHTHVTHEEDKAERYFKQLLQVDPNNVGALLSYASFTQTVKKKTTRAAMLFEKALVAGPHDPSANNSMACFLIDQKRDLDRAESLLKNAVEANPDYVPALANLALISVRLKRDSTSAMGYYERAIAAAGKRMSAKLATEFAIFLHLTAKEYDRAEEMYEKALSINGEYEDAIVHYSKFLKDIRRNPAQANAMYNRRREIQKRKMERSNANIHDASENSSVMSREVSAGSMMKDDNAAAAGGGGGGDSDGASSAPAVPAKPAPPAVGRPDRAAPSPRAKQLLAEGEEGANTTTAATSGADDDDDESKPAIPGEEEEKPKVPAHLARRGMRFNPNRRQSVSAEVLGRFFGHAQAETKKIPKTPEQQDQIQKSIGRNMLFAHLEDDQKKEVTDAMFEMRKAPGEVIIKQGDDGDNFYVLAEGTCEVTLVKNGEEINAGTIHPGGSFGELALMYNTPRAATITAKDPCVLWAVDRTTFRRILLISTLNRRRQYEDFLARVPILADLTSYERSSLADAVTGQTIEDGHVIVKQGDPGEAFFLIIDGEVLITRKDNAWAPEQTIGVLKSGEYFGEIALLTDAPRQATVTAVGQCRLARLDREAFDRLLGPCLDVLRRNIGQYEAIISQGLDRPDGNTGTANASPGSPSTATTNATGAVDGASQIEVTGDSSETSPGPNFARKRKGGVSAEAMGRFQEDHKNVVIEKDPQSLDRIHRILEILKERNFLFRDLDSSQEQRLVDAMFEEKKQRGEYVIRQGEEGDHFYMLDQGQCQVLISSKPGEKPKKFGDLMAGDTFGELALMYNCPRAASIVAVTPVSLWALDRSTFRHVLQDSAIEKRRKHESFLETVPLFKNLSAYEKTTIADCLFHGTYHAGDTVFEQGDKALYLYFVVQGSAVVSRNGDEIKELGPGDHFGEDGLIGEASNYYVKVVAGGEGADDDLVVYYMDRGAFKRVLGEEVISSLKSRIVADLGHSAIVTSSSPNKPAISIGGPATGAGAGGLGAGLPGTAGARGLLGAPNAAMFAMRRKSVSAEVFSRQELEREQNEILPEVPKTEGQIQQLRKACLKNFLFAGLDGEMLEKAMKVMFEVKASEGDEIITQGDGGDNFYVLAQGKCEVSMTRAGQSKVMGVVEPGGSFGELALMYNTPRAATVKALTDVTLWAIDRQGFRQLILGSSLRKRRQYEEFMDQVPLFKPLTPYERSTIADAFVEEHFRAGETVFRQGAVGDKFYIVVRGEAVVTSQESSFVPEKEIKRLKRGDYFGEIALLQDKGRLFAVRASNDEPLTVCSLGRDAFKRLLGPIKLILQRNTEIIYSEEVSDALNESDYDSDDETQAEYDDETESGYETPRHETPDPTAHHPAASAADRISPTPDTEQDSSSKDDAPKVTTAQLADRRQHRQGRRQGVSAEVMGRFFEEKTEIKVIPKTEEQVAQIQKSIAGSFLFNSLDDEEVKEVTDAMFEVKHGPREDIIKQGDDGDNFYVIAEGNCEALISKGTGPARKVAEIGPGGSFGELALMYNTPRAATVRSINDVTLWAVDRTTFRRCVLTSTINKRKQYEDFLAAVPIFESLTPYERAQLADAFQTTEFKDGEAIVTQGDSGDTFYVLVEGECKIEHSPSYEAEPVDVGRIHKGRYFGELALITNKPRAVTIRALGSCKLVALQREAFDSLLGPIIDVLKRNAGSYQSLKDSAVYKAALSDTQQETPDQVSSKLVESAREEAEVKQEVLTTVLPRAMFDPRARRASVSAEVLGRFFKQKEEKIKVIPKTPEQTEQIQRAITKNFLFQGLDETQLQEVIDSMFEKRHAKGDVVMKQGDDGDNFYVLASGSCRVDMTKAGVESHVGDVGPGGSFGELALMYNTPRAATITCSEDCVLWAVDRVTFRRILLISTLNKRRQYELFLSKVPILQSLEPYERSALADAFTSVDIGPNERVVAQGDSGDQFYIIEKGEFVVSHRPNPNAQETEIGRLGPGDYFGEVSLLTTKPRAASITSTGAARVVSLSRGAFTRLLGPCIDILKRNLNTYTELKTTGDYKEALQNAIEFETESGDGISPSDTRPQSELATPVAATPTPQEG